MMNALLSFSEERQRLLHSSASFPSFYRILKTTSHLSTTVPLSMAKQERFVTQTSIRPMYREIILPIGNII
jgi:hypothetical protein